MDFSIIYLRVKVIISIVAPEIFATYINKAKGYSFEVDWWSLGISVCEMVRGKVCSVFCCE